ncbi:MAG TPA: GNAT family N-acetyltransferase [Hyphomicrobiaceae bacterium]|nr:GNAT family N-acetyltransferase [Hyphomicrobiaceae bacterium]
MVFSMFGGGGPQIRAMQRSDLGGVLRIIHGYDEDDFEEARDDLQEDIDGMLVLTKGSTVIGVTGATPDPQTEGVVWLSWTYIDRVHKGQGFGRQLVGGLLDAVRAEGFRKLFISTSDYKDEGEDIYAPARAFYEKSGAKLEVVLPDYHARGESRYVYGLDLQPPPSRNEHPSGGALRFIDIEPAPESENGLALVWEEVQGNGPIEGIDSNLEAMVAKARAERARVLVAAVPSDLCGNIGAPLQVAGFEHRGRLIDYFAPNIHQELGILRL